MNNKIKIWIGTVPLDEESYLKYFELDYKSDGLDDPRYKVCGFCKDIGFAWYDEDFIGIIPVMNHIVEVEKLISQTPLNSSNREQVKNDCLKMGIDKGNAILFYSGETREIISGEDFNGLKYIGEYSM